MVTASDTETPKDDPTFDVLPLTPEVRSAVDDMGYVHPTPVQCAVFESASRGKDLVAQARTGTGKTAAFGLPLVDRIVRRKIKAVQALVLCPTRELALQVTRELGALGKNTGIQVLPIYGGAPMPKQIEGLKDGAQIIVGTPGRVLDHLRRKTLDPAKARVFVLDECDEMLSMGFLPQILEIWNQLPKELQVLLFSATVPRPVLRIAESRLREPEFITLSGDQVGALEIEHYVYLSQGDKVQELLRILKAEAPESAIIFCNTRDDTQRVANELKRSGYKSDWLNADLSQKEREAVMAATREGRLPFLVCTDVAARGIDISHLTHVINFDFPEATEQYVHRTGRTGRAGRMGTAISLVSPASIGNLYYLRLEYKIHPIERQLPSDRELRTRAETDAVRDLATRFPNPRESERLLVRRLLTHDRAEAIIAGLLREYQAAQSRPQTIESISPLPGTTEAVRAANVEQAATVTPTEAATTDTEPRRRRAPRESEGRAERQRPERNRIGSAGPVGRARRPPRDAQKPHEEEGIRYEVRDVSDADLAALQTEPNGSAEENNPDAVTNADAPSARTARSSGAAVLGTVGSDDDQAGARSGPASTWEGPFEEAFVNVGRDDGARAPDVERALRSAGINEEDTAYVRIRQRHTFIGVRAGLLDQLIGGLNGQKIAERMVEAQPARSRQARR